MIVSKTKEISQIIYKRTLIGKVYLGLILILEAIRSCFGKGWWINDKGWNNQDAWKN